MGEETRSEQLRDWSVITQLVSVRANVCMLLCPFTSPLAALLERTRQGRSRRWGNFLLRKDTEIHSCHPFFHRRCSCPVGNELPLAGRVRSSDCLAAELGFGKRSLNRARSKSPKSYSCQNVTRLSLMIKLSCLNIRIWSCGAPLQV